MKGLYRELDKINSNRSYWHIKILVKINITQWSYWCCGSGTCTIKDANAPEISDTALLHASGRYCLVISTNAQIKSSLE